MNRLTILLVDGTEHVYESQHQRQGFSAERLPSGDLVVHEHNDDPDAELAQGEGGGGDVVRELVAVAQTL